MIMGFKVIHLIIGFCLLSEFYSIDITLTKKEYESWIKSPAGKEAIKLKQFKPSKKQAENYKRYAEAKEKMLALSKDHPNAELSMNTPFALMPTEEFLKKYTMSIDLGNFDDNKNLLRSENSSTTLASANNVIDWSENSNCINEVVNQGNCGSCWAFAAVGALESAYCIKTGQFLSFSQQQLVSCASRNGCGGGWVDRAYQWLIDYSKRGICALDAFPYYAQNTRCYKCKPLSINLQGYNVLNTEGEAYQALQSQPLSIYVEVTAAWQYYTGGALTLSSGQPNHAVLLIGYNPSNGLWKIKNSWGTSWGQDGYVTGTSGTGGIHSPIYPIF